MLLASGVIGFLILLTALYVAAEFAAVGVRRSRLRRMAEDGHPLACRLLPTLEDPEELDRYIAVSQVGITLSSLVLGAYGQAVLAPRLEPLLLSFGLQPPRADSWAALFVLLSLTVAHMILGELVPKSLALQFPTQTALLTVLPMQWSQRMLKWSISALNGSGIVLLKLLRVPPTGHRHVHSPQEIELLIAESRDGGLLEPQEQVRLHRALRLGLRTARELMVPRARLAGIDEGAPFEAVLRVVIASPWIFYQIWSFISAGLYPHERAYVYRFLTPSIGLFLTGVLMCQFLVLPGAVRALLGFNMWIDMDPEIRLNEWLSFAILLPLVFGVAFQTPLVMFILNRLGMFGWEDYWSRWRYAVIILAILSALLTPTPDAVTMHVNLRGTVFKSLLWIFPLRLFEKCTALPARMHP